MKTFISKEDEEEKEEEEVKTKEWGWRRKGAGRGGARRRTDEVSTGNADAWEAIS